MRATSIGRIPCIALWALLSPAASSAQDPMHRRYTVRDGLPSDHVYSVTQDREGFIWFGTNAGASRFDGTSFTNFSLEDGLPDKEVINIAEDSQGRIWFMLLNGRLCYWKDGEMHHEGTDPGLKYEGMSSGLHAMGEDQQGRIWFGGVYGSMLRVTPDAQVDSVFDRRSEFGDLGFIHSVAYDRNGKLLLFQGRGLWVPDGDGLRRVPVQHDVLHLGMVMSASLPGRPALALTDEGISTFQADGTCEALSIPVPLDKEISRRCWEDREGTIWVQRRTNGIEILTPIHGTYAHQLLFPEERVNHALVAPDGMRWLCTDNGVVCFSEAQQRARHSGADRGRYLSLHKNAEGVLFAGTEESGLFAITPSGERHLALPAGRLGPGRIMRIAGGTTGDIWVAAHHALYHVQRDGRMEPVPFDYDGLNNKHISRSSMFARCVSVGARGEVISSSAGLQKVVRSRGRPVRQNINWAELGHYRVEPVYQDDRSRIWFATGEWLRLLENGRARSIDLQGAGSRQAITDITGLGPDSLLIGTRGGGLVLLDAKGMAKMLQGADDEAKDVRRVRVLGDTIWVATTDGVRAYYLGPGGLYERLCYKEVDGLASLDCHDMVPYGDGMLAVATAMGLSIVPIAGHRHRDRELMGLHFTEVMCNDSVVSPFGTIDVVSGRTLLTVRIAPIAFLAPDRVEYEWRASAKEEWRPVTHGVIHQLDHPVGRYRLEIRARLHGEEWSAFRALDMRSTRPWYLQYWTMALFVLTAVALVAGGVSIVQRIKQGRELRRLSALQKLSEERRRIAADVHDDLGADLSHLLGQARMVKAGSAGIDQLTEGIGRSMDKIDDIIWSLDPDRDTVRSTAEFIETWTRNYVHAHGLAFRSNIKVSAEEPAIQADQRRELALVVKEAVRNIVKHAKATSVHLFVDMQGGRMVVVLQDDGELSPIGRTSGRQSGSLNMLRRVERLGGRSHFEPVAPQGTRFTVEVDLLRS